METEGSNLHEYSIEFFYNPLFPAKSWLDPASIDGEEQNKKVALLGIEPTTSRSSVLCSANCASKESVGGGGVGS